MHRVFALVRRGQTRPISRWTSGHRAWYSTTSRDEPKASRSNVVSKTQQVIQAAEVDSLIIRKLFFVPAFKPYLGIEGVELRGLYNYGPPGADLQDNILDVWRKHFILEEDMLKVDCPVITPHEIFKTSGHVEKFTDYMCKDIVTGEHYRADHLVKEVLERRLNRTQRKILESEAEELDGAEESGTEEKISTLEHILIRLSDISCKEMGRIIRYYNILSPNGNPLELPTPVNLMFETPIGPSGKTRGYLRPETAQGQFLMFQELLAYNNRNMPFASASIGKSYRNEISPKSGILRVREFTMAEIEHFMDPHADKSHPRFGEVQKIDLPLLTREQQMDGVGGMSRGTVMSVGEAVAVGIVNNETLGYFLARTYLFLLKIGIDPWKLRFRQHLSNEMAHYAVDCWDVELYTTYGWIECVGLADRSAYDLTAHSNRTGEQLGVQAPMEVSEEIEEYVPVFNMAKFGPRFKGNGMELREALRSKSQEELERLAHEMTSFGRITLVFETGVLTLEKDVVTIEKRPVTKISTRTDPPSVIEPSFGIGRIMYALMEHSIDRRPGDDQARLVLSFPPTVAPTKVLIYPLQLNEPRFMPFASQLQRFLRTEGISARIDAASRASIGKRYSRNDEVGTPLGITIDFQSLNDQTVTLRERDSMEQVRGNVPDICQAIVNIVNGKEAWADVHNRLPKVHTATG